MQKPNWVQPDTMKRVHLVTDDVEESYATDLEEPEPEPDLTLPSDTGGESKTKQTNSKRYSPPENTPLNCSDESALSSSSESIPVDVFQAPSDSTAAHTSTIPSSPSAQDRTDSKDTEIQNSGPAPVSTAQNTGSKKFGSYELYFEIRKDALSTTWAAKRHGVDQTLALRIFNARLTDSTQVRNIHKAARKASELTHINHVTVYEDGVSDDGAPYIVTDWVEGDTLAETFQVSKRLDIARFLNIFNQVGEALIDAHSHLLVHGNLSPNKIILVHEDNDAETEIVKLIDFGMPPDPVQNAFYLSPEQCLDRNKCNERSDIYSLGCIMYESLVGSPPFIGDRVSQASTNYLHEMANQYSKESPEHNALKLLDCIIIKCLQKKQSARFANVRELLDALRLVSDCICHGSKKKLPRKAEKLLLFRFLEFFDRKIVIGLCAYMILGMVSLKYLGELQLQRSIDEAQLYTQTDFPRAVTNWKKALLQARLSQKPPGLQADLNWELADALKRQFFESKTPETRNALANEAAQHYQAAYEYYRRGSNYHSHSLALLQNLSSMWLMKVRTDEPVDDSSAAQTEVKKLFDAKQYAKCAQVAAKYYNTYSDPEIANYAGSANHQLGFKLPAKKALRYYATAEYYFKQSGKSSYPSLVRPCMRKLGYDFNAESTHLNLGLQALADNDLDAAEYHFDQTPWNEFRNGINGYRALSSNKISWFSDSENAIGPLQQYLKLQEDVYGKQAKSLTTTLLHLAHCYEKQGDSHKAIDCYKRAFAIIPDEEQMDRDVLSYVNLLAKQWHRQEARRELEKRIIVDKEVNAGHALFPRLLEAYASDKMKDKALKLVKSVCHMPEIQKSYEIYDQGYARATYNPSAPYANALESLDAQDPFRQ